MNYLFTPSTDDELDTIDLAPEGIYDFEIIKAERKISRSGNNMAALQLLINDNGAKRIIFDWLVFSEVNMCKKKVSHFCKAVGLVEEYKQGKLREELDGYEGKVEIGIGDMMPNPSGGFYPKKNVVIDYIADKENKNKLESSEATEDNPFVDSDIPFWMT